MYDVTIGRSFPTWIPGQLLPDEIEDLTEQITDGHRGDGGTRDPHELFPAERREAEHVFTMARELLSREVPL